MFGGMAFRGGIDLGGTKIQTAIVDDAGEVAGQSRRPTPTGGGPAGVADEMAAALREAADAAGIETGALEGIGVGSPGRVDDAAGTVTGAKNLPGWDGSFDVRGALEGACGAPVSLGNDVQVATDGEFALGAGRDFNSLLGVFWGTGVGGGIIARRQAVDRPRRGRRDRPRRGEDRRRAVPVRAQGLHGGLRRPLGDGAARAPRASSAARRPSCSRSWRSAAASG